MKQKTAERIRENFGAIWPAHVENLTRFLIQCRQTFGGDLDLFLVMAVVGERTFSARNADKSLDFEKWQTGGARSGKREEINATSIAHFSGIPRETVRRKLAVLKAKGWIIVDERGSYLATSKSSVALEPLTRESIEYLAIMHDVIAANSFAGKR
jgi:CRP-like cAMP-binding protein